MNNEFVTPTKTSDKDLNLKFLSPRMGGFLLFGSLSDKKDIISRRCFDLAEIIDRVYLRAFKRR